MKKTITILTSFLAIIFFIGCKKDSSCHMVSLNESFVASYGCKYCCQINSDTTIEIEFIDIEDYRTYGASCMQSTGGYASIFLKSTLVDNGRNNTNYLKSTVIGCSIYDNTQLNDPSVLPLQRFGQIKLKLLNLYPLSPNITKAPKSKKEYSIKLGFTDKN